jgi:hypothetical protein
VAAQEGGCPGQTARPRPRPPPPLRGGHAAALAGAEGEGGGKQPAPSLACRSQDPRTRSDPWLSLLGCSERSHRTLPGRGELPDKQLLSVAEIALTSAVLERLRGSVEPTFFPDFTQPRLPDADYSFRLALCAPDLRTATWFQVAGLIDRKRPLRNSEVCGTPFPLTKRNRVTCSVACRKRKSRRNLEDRG